MPIFPQPQKIERLAPAVTLADQGQVRCCLVLDKDAEPLERAAADLLADAIAARAGERPRIVTTPACQVPIYVGKSASADKEAVSLLASTPGTAEAYALLVRDGSLALIGQDSPGTFYAAQTLKQMLRQQDGRLVVDSASIVDWPDYRYRGLYIESKWGPDLMSLQDWRDLIDYMASLKFNSLGIGVYCCWVVQYEGQRTEFLMVPFPDHPELRTPKTIKYYSAQEGAWQALTYLPRMFAEDFLGDLISYARSRNVTVRPHFNGPGHTTLIPHTHPEVAAKDDAGRPQEYGYCLSSPQTYDLLFELWDSIIDRYLAPNGVDWFHMGLDEIWMTKGVDQEEPERVVDPWCKCPACRAQSQNELLTEYVLKATQHLASRGIHNITIWYDHLNRSGLLTPEFVRRLDEAGVKENVILQWWRYDEPVLEIPEDLGLRSWVTPMSGYYSWLFTQSYTSNIYPHLNLAFHAGAEGADAYCIFDPAFDRNYHCLAEYAWNQTSSADLYQFKSRYAQKVMGTSGFGAAEAFEKWDQVYDSMPLVPTILDMLLFYWHTYSQARFKYPGNVVRALADDRLRVMGACRRARTHLLRAHALFASRRDEAPDPALIDQYLFECQRLIRVVDAYDAILQGIEQSKKAVTEPDPERARSSLVAASQVLGHGLQGLDELIVFAEQVKKSYLLPQLLRDLGRLRAYLAGLAAATQEGLASREAMQRLKDLLAQAG